MNVDLKTQPLYTWEGAHGFLRNWFICGFFPAEVIHSDRAPNLFDSKESTHWETDHLTAWGGEAAITDLPQVRENKNALEWLPIQGDEFEQKLSINALQYYYPQLQSALTSMDENDQQWYALSVLESACQQTVILKYSVQDGSRVFHNGTLIHDTHSWHGVIYDEHSIEITLCAGRNTLLFKNERQSMVARIVDTDGNAPEGLQQCAGNDAPDRRANSAHSLRAHCASLTVEMPFTGKNPDELKKWQSEFLPIYNNGFGKDLPQLKAGTQVHETGRVSCDGYTRHMLQIPCEGDSHFDAAVLIPDDDRRNGKTIITPHGHRFLFEHIIGFKPEPQPRWSQIGPEDGNYNERLAQAGFVTAAFCQRGFDNRNDLNDGHACNSIGRMALAMGYRLPNLYLSDISRLADYIGGLDGVDGNNLGLAGLSGGATISWICGAREQRFAAIASFCGLMRARHWINSGGSCGMQVLPDVFPSGDTGEILSLIAPRALLIGQGRLDATFNVLASKSIYNDARTAWIAAGVEDKIEYALIESGHQFHVPTAATFFEKNL